MSLGHVNQAQVLSPLYAVLREITAGARHHDPELTSWKGIRQAVLEAADFLRAEAHEMSPPIDLMQIAKLRRIYRFEYFPATRGPEAVLVPTEDGFLIRLPKDRPSVRHRSSIAHEIGHTLFYDIRSNRPIRLLSWGVAGRPSQKEEDICKAFARELLMPRQYVADERKANPGMKGIALLSHFASRFRVSEELVTVRLMWDLADLRTFVAIFKDGQAQDQGRTTSIRRYFGEELRRPRKGEKQILESVTHALKRSIAQQALVEIAADSSDDISLEWKSVHSEGCQSYLVLLGFHR